MGGVAQSDPYAGVGTAVGAPPPAAPAGADPYAGVGAPVGAPNPTNVTKPTNVESPQIGSPAIANLASNLAAPFTDTTKGVVKGGMHTVAGVLRLLGDGRQANLDAQQQQNVARGIETPDQAAAAPKDWIADHTKAAADWLNVHAQDHGMWQHIGDFGESALELMTPEALAGLVSEPAKVAKAGETAAAVSAKAKQMTDAAKAAKLLDGSPRIKALVMLGARFAARAGAEAGGQTLVKSGGDVDEAEKAAAYGAAGGAVLHGAASAVGGVARRMARPALMRDVVEGAAQGSVADRVAATNATRTMPTNALPPSTGDFEFNIQGTPTTERVEGSSVAEPRKKQVGTKYVPGKGAASGSTEAYPAGTFQYGDEAPLPHVEDQQPFAPGGSHKEPVHQYLTATKPGTENVGTDVAGGGGTLTTKDPAIASAHLASVNRTIDGADFANMPEEQQDALTTQRDDIQQQLANYYKHQKATGEYAPNFKPIDPKAAVDSTGNFRDAANHLQDAAAEVYEHANNVTGGQWQALDKHVQSLYDKLGDEPYPAGRAQIRKQISTAKSAMGKMFDDPRNGFDETDIAQAKRNFRARYVLEDAHQALKPLYGIEEQTGLKTGEYRGFNGDRLGARFKEFLAANPDARDIIGPERADTLQQIFKANDTVAARRRFGSAVLNVARTLGGGAVAGGVGYHAGGYAGAAVAEVGYQAVQHVLTGMVSNPNVAKNILYAIDSGARPENYSPMIATMIKKALPLAAGKVAQAQGGTQ